MVMKVLSTPAAEPWSMEAVCFRCETKVELEIDDFTSTSTGYRGDRGEDVSPSSVWDCPTCSGRNDVNHDKIPKRLHHKLPKLSGGGYFDR